MKKIYTLLTGLILTTNIFAQAPEKMSYQAIVRNASDALVTSTAVGMQISILQGSTTGTVAYAEVQNPTTNTNGLISLEIGTGTSSDDFSSIDWTNGPYFIKTETDPTGGTDYTITGTSQLLSVPYALHAKTAESITGTITEVDGSITNEIQDLQLSGNNLTITNNGSATTIDLTPYLNTDTTLTETQVDAFTANNGYITTEVDASTTNEIQDLQLSGNNLTITNNGTATTIDLTPYLNTDTTLTETQVDAFTANNGYITAEVDASTTNEIQDLQLSGNNLTITNNGSASTIDLTPYLNTDTTLTETEVDAFTANNGYLTAEVDASTTNEIQDLQISGNNLTITNNGSASTIDLTPYLNTDTTLTETEVDAFAANNGYLTAEVDGSITNEIELPSQTGQSGKYLTTNGTSPSWSTVAGGAPNVKTISANTTLVNSDEIVIINGSFTATLPASPTDGMRLMLCTGNPSAIINGNGKSLMVANVSLPSLSFNDGSTNMYIFIYSSTIGSWLGAF